ncbi:aminotransferase class III-fold pyridoxal phosphate-dependent enzyme [SAR202 cluster bacterium AD-802-E10_MRT_200m]|nr:aminotransferase class III-fold pyridoxal phosphate-dependent enzyme [SAR202 cluster bacterium AD-802-E10_MRT_200m]
MADILGTYREKHNQSALLADQAQMLFPDGVTHDTRYVTPFGLTITHAKGSRKWDVDGNEYVDYVMGHGALLLGHGHPSIVTAVTEQIVRGTHLGGNHMLESEWAKLVIQLIPSAEKVRFTSSGTEATLLAARLARAFTGREKILKFSDHFHGWNDYMMAGSGRGNGGIPNATLSTMGVLPPNDIDQVEVALKSNEDIAAVILEPTGAHMGTLPVYPSFLRELREVTQRYNVLLIFDEVVTGFRVSPGGAQSKFGVTPDMTTLAKILGGGLPGGAVGGRADILDMIAHNSDPAWDDVRRVAHPGTFNANPISAAAGIKALELIADGKANVEADKIASSIRKGINSLLARMEIPGCCYGISSFFHLQFGRPCVCLERDVCTRPHAEISSGMSGVLAMNLKRAMLNSGIDLMGGRMGIVSASHNEEDVDRTLAAFEEGLDAMRREGLV